MCVGEVHTIEGQSSEFRVVEIGLKCSTYHPLRNCQKMLQAKQVLQERYYLQQSLGQNTGRQTWLAQE
jgi:hypothetical protein